MPASKRRLRQPPAERFAGSEHRIDFASAAKGLRAEPHDGREKHRQMTVFRKGSLRLVLFAFEAGGHLPPHRAPGFIAIQALRGTIRVTTPNETHELNAGQTVVLEPGVQHEVAAPVESDMLLTVALSE